MISESKFIIVGQIEKFGNIPEYIMLFNVIFLKKICQVLSDGIQIGLSNFVSLISTSYDNNGIIYFTYSSLNKNSFQYTSNLVSWNENNRKKKKYKSDIQEIFFYIYLLYIF